MNTILMAFIKKSILTEAQNGFREGKSTKTAFQDLLKSIQAATKKMYLIGIFFDISKAYNVSNHRILLSKLDAHRIRGVGNLWFKSHLSNGNEYA
jgi:hypothetical protein